MEAARVTAPARFVVVRPIGEGATSEVLEVVDRRTGGRFALKRLRSTFASPGRVSRFKNEYRALERICHPNLAKVYELVAERDEMYLVMELVQGGDFFGFVRPGSARMCSHTVDSAAGELASVSHADEVVLGGRLSVERLRAALVQLVCGLRALHAAGKIHCDIKPENVLVTPEGRLVIVDFGLVTETVCQSQWRGTPAFMAPEQFGGQITEAVDWYAVGRLLLAALTGRLATLASPTSSALQSYLVLPSDPRHQVDGLPDDLVELALRMLDPRPHMRPKGDEVARSLKLAFEPPKSSGFAAPTFVGRVAELERLTTAYAAVSTGAARIVHLVGESGIGKTALVSRFAQVIEERGGSVYRGACYRQASVPYNGLDSIVDSIATHLTQHQVTLEPEEGEALAAMFQVFRSEDWQASAAPPANVLRTRAVAALRRLLERLAQHGGLVLCIDDAQWSDTESADVLAELMPLPGLLLVLAYRSTTGVWRSSLRNLRRKLPFDDELTLGPLEPSAQRTLIESNRALADGQIEALMRESGGNPFFIEELTRACKVDGSGDAPSLERVLAKRIGTLPSSQRALLDLVCIAGRPLDESVLRRALGAPQEQGLEARHALISGSFVRMADGDRHAIEPYHDRVRAHVLHELLPGQLRERHTTLAEAYEAEGLIDPEILTFHYTTAGDLVKARLYGELAGDAATRAFACDHAAELYRAALAIADASCADRLSEKLAHALSAAGRPWEAARAFQTILERRPDDLNTLLSAGDELFKAGALAEGAALLRQVGVRLGEPIPKRRLFVLLGVLWNWLMYRCGRPAPLREKEPAEAIEPRMLFCMTIAKQFIWLDVASAALFSLRYLRLSLRNQTRVDVAQALACEACFVASAPAWPTGNLREADRLLGRATALVRDTDPALTIASVHFSSAATVAFAHGRWRSCVQLFEHALCILRECQQTGLQWTLAFCQCGIVESLRVVGDVSEIRRRVSDFKAEAKGFRSIEAYHALRGEVLVALCDDAPDEAERIVSEVMAAWPGARTGVQSYFEAVARIDIALYRGDRAGAAKQFPDVATSMRELMLHRSPHYLVLHLALRACVALTTGALSAANQRIRRLLSRREPWARSVGKALDGCLLAHRGDYQRALRVLGEAADLVTESGLLLYGVAVRHRLAMLKGDAHTQQEALAELASWGVRAPTRIISMILPLPVVSIQATVRE